MDEQVILRRLDKIEHQLKFFADTYRNLHNIFIQGVHVKLEKELLNPTLSQLTNQLKEFRDLYNQINDIIKKDSILGTLAFMAKRLHEIDITIQGIKEEGLKKKIQLDLTMDGYEMVKKKPSGIETNTCNPEDALNKLLGSLIDREAEVITHRFGLFGHKVKTLVATGKEIGLTGERVRAIEHKALRKMRMPARRNLSLAITHAELKKAIFGDSE